MSRFRHPRFREESAAEMAARFLTLHDRPMKYIKLLKLMYIAERRHLLDQGRSITYDQFKSLPLGPIMSDTMDLIKSEPVPGTKSVFRDRIKGSEDYRVELVGEDTPEDSPLSRAQRDLIDEVYQEFGSMKWPDLVKYTHEHFPEWEDPGPSSKPIHVRTILERDGKPEPVVDTILAEINEVAIAEEVFSL